MKRCPSCGRGIQDAASKCHHCGTVVRQPRVPGHPDAGAPHPRPKEPRTLPFPIAIAITFVVFVVALAWFVW